MLCDVVSKNGNLLLNIGPKADGVFQWYANRLLAMGDWLVNGEAIYKTSHEGVWKTKDVIEEDDVVYFKHSMHIHEKNPLYD